MNIIKRHKGLAIIGSLSLVLLIIMFIIVGRMFFNENNSTYGDRLNGLKIDTSIFTKVKDEYSEMKEVTSISTRIQGKIIYTTIKFKEGTKLAKAKELATKVLEYFEEDDLKAYDFGFYLVEDIESSSEKTGFLVAGNKHPDNKTISWTE